MEILFLHISSLSPTETAGDVRGELKREEKGSGVVIGQRYGTFPSVAMQDGKRVAA